ncbi:MAG: hypothetical protein GVY34_12860 [Alphaproteobacteria bacterium]|jgi:thioredoxin-like negative regulator of GroEL|nr:hypothetical protein [Alphaproteobacteria bacterium]
MDPEDPELWLCHYVGGAWRAPLSTRVEPVRSETGRMLGRVVLANAADLARAKALSRKVTAQDERVYQQQIARMDLRNRLRRISQPGSVTGPIYLAHPEDAVVALDLACKLHSAGLRPGAFALLFHK